MLKVYNPSMLEQERLWRDLMALPPEAQQMVADYVAELHRRYAQAPAGDATDLCNEPFIGLWRDREDLEDFVKRVRTREWRLDTGELDSSSTYSTG
jgi:DNA-directed RNA polymerase specialized sigma24 family protein